MIADDEEQPEPAEPRSFLGLPLRMLLAIGCIGLPLLAVGWFSATHTWPPPPDCGFAIFGCPSAPYPIGSQAVDWIDLAGPLLGVVSGAAAIRLTRDPAEARIAIVLFRYAIPIVGLLVSVGCAAQLSIWITH